MSWINKAHTYFSNNYVLAKSTSGWWNFSCPFCNELSDRKKCAVRFTWNIVKCWVCEYRGSIIDFVMSTEDIDYYSAKLLIADCKPSGVDLEIAEEFKRKQSSDIDMPKGYVPILEGDGILGVRARNYLQSRNFDLADMDRLGIGYCNAHDEDDYFGYILIPFISKGLLQYYIGRDYIGNFLRYKNPAVERFGVGKSDILFNEDALDLYKTIFVQEGCWDAMTIGKNGVATLGWSLSGVQKNKLMNSYADNIVFVPDAGKDGTGKSFYSKAVNIAMDFIDRKKNVYVLDMEKLADYGKDINEVGRERVMDLYRNTEPLTEEYGLEILML